MKKVYTLLAAILLSFSLGACLPEVTTPTEPSVTAEEGPINGVYLGEWTGRLHSQANFVVNIVFCIDTVTESEVRGTVEFPDEPLETLGRAYGFFRSTGELVLFLRAEVGHEVVTLNLTGFVTDGVFSGNTVVLGTPAVFQFVWSDRQ